MRRTLSTVLVLAVAMAMPAMASSHREAPGTMGDPTIDTTDLYAFRDSLDTVTIIVNHIPGQEPAGGPNFYSFADDAVYNIHVDNNGDAVPDITWQFDFNTEIVDDTTFLYNNGPVTSLQDENLNIRQYYTVTRLGGDGATSVGDSFQVAPYDVGPKSTPDYDSLAEMAVYTMESGMQVFAGPRDDPFFVDLGSIFDLLTLRPVQNLHQVPPVLDPANGVDTLAGFNVHTIAIRVPITMLSNDGQMPSSPSAGNAIIGVWATTDRARVSVRTNSARRLINFSGTTQVSRLGNPLVNEVVMSLKFKDIFNGSSPSGDAALFTSNQEFADRVLDPEVAKLYTALYGLEVPEAPRMDLQQVFLTGVPGLNMPEGVQPAEVLRLNMAIIDGEANSNLGVIGGDVKGFPNGRRLGDDVVDIALRVVAGVLVDGFNVAPNNALTDGVDSNDLPFMTEFPFVAPPHSGFDSVPHPGSQQ